LGSGREFRYIPVVEEDMEAHSSGEGMAVVLFG
jgi:hypothetical protein